MPLRLIEFLRLFYAYFRFYELKSTMYLKYFSKEPFVELNTASVFWDAFDLSVEMIF
jgi:hypothetical protein